MQSEVLAAIIGGAAGTLTSTLTALFQRKRVNAEINKLAAETEHLREETEAAKKRPLELERKAYETVLAAFLDRFRSLVSGTNQLGPQQSIPPQSLFGCAAHQRGLINQPGVPARQKDRKFYRRKIVTPV